MHLAIVGFLALILGPGCWYRSCPSNEDCGQEVTKEIDSDDFADECPFDSLAAVDTADTGAPSCADACEALAQCLTDVHIERQISCELSDDRVRCTVAEAGECLDQC